MEHGDFFQGGTAQGDSARGRRSGGGVSACGHEAESDWRGALRGVVEAEILPRLRRSHPPGAASPIAATPGDIESFARLLLAKDGAEALAHLAGLRERASGGEGAFLEVLTRTARHLGKLWEADDCDFVDVTIGLRRLHFILNALSAEVEAAVEIAPNARRVLLLPAPGESHGFGIAMVRFSFRAAGWRADCGVVADHLARLRAEWFDLVGFSVSCDNRLDPLRGAVEGVRRASRNPGVLIMVGGPALSGKPEIALAAGADGSANDAAGAVIAAQSLLDRRAPV